MEETNKTSNVTFLWTVIDSIEGLDLLVPCLIRSDEKKYVSIRIIYKIVFSLFDNKQYRHEMFKSFKSSVQQYPCTAHEITLLNEINCLHTSQAYGNKLFADGEFMCQIDELLIFYNASLKEQIMNNTRNTINKNLNPYQIQAQNSLKYRPVIQNNRPAWQDISLIHRDHYFNQNLPAQNNYPCQMLNPFLQNNQHHQVYPRQQTFFPANMYAMPPSYNNSQFTHQYPNMTQAHSFQSIPCNTSYPPFHFANPTPQPIYNYVPHHSFQQFQPNESFMHPGSQFISNSASNMFQTPLLKNSSLTTPLHLNNPQIRPIPQDFPPSEPFNQFCINAANFNQTNILSRPVNQSSPLNENQSCIDKENFFKNQSLTKQNSSTSNVLNLVRLADPEIILNSHQITDKTLNIDAVQPYCKHDSNPLHIQALSIPDKSLVHADSLVTESFLKKDNNNSNSNKELIDQIEPNSVENEEDTQEEESLLDKNESCPTEELIDFIESLISSVIKTAEFNQISVKNKMNSNESSFNSIFENDIEEEPNQEENNNSTIYIEPKFNSEDDDNESKAKEDSSKEFSKMDSNEQPIAEANEKSCEISKISSSEENIETVEKNKTSPIKRKLIKVKRLPNRNSKRMKSTELRSSRAFELKVLKELKAEHANDKIKNLLIKNGDVFCTDDDFDEDYYLKRFKLKKCFVNLPSFN